MTAAAPLGRIDGAEAFRRAFNVSRETMDRLEAYAALVRLWQPKINLIAPSTVGEIWHRHFADSAQLDELIPLEARSLVDLGSGGGFPGMVLAVLRAERSKATVTLIESDQRKAAFLGEVSRRLVIPVEILSTRIESRETQTRVALADVVTARALAPMVKLLDWVAPFLGPASVALLMKGRDAEREVAAARSIWRFDVEYRPSRTDAEARIVLVRGLSAVGET
jgi:16S rRNA (guanine527-N7)-methyltransferase